MSAKDCVWLCVLRWFLGAYWGSLFQPLQLSGCRVVRGSLRFFWHFFSALCHQFLPWREERSQRGASRHGAEQGVIVSVQAWGKDFGASSVRKGAQELC